jgi:MFS family permease
MNNQNIPNSRSTRNKTQSEPSNLSSSAQSNNENLPELRAQPAALNQNKFFHIGNANLALAIMCTSALMQNILIGGANNSILTTIERAYYMTSIESALFLSFYDIANIIASPIIGYFGDHFFKPKILSMSMFGLSIASFTMILPVFINSNTSDPTIVKMTLLSNQTNVTSSGDEDGMLCMSDIISNNKSSYFQSTISTLTLTQHLNSQNDVNPLLYNMKFVFYLANMINGVSSVALYTIAISFIENIFKKDQVNVRQGLYYAIGAIGVGIGMLATGNFLNINGSVKRIRKLQHQPNNSNNVNWIGVRKKNIFGLLLKEVINEFSLKNINMVNMTQKHLRVMKFKNSLRKNCCINRYFRSH